MKLLLSTVLRSFLLMITAILLLVVFKTAVRAECVRHHYYWAEVCDMNWDFQCRRHLRRGRCLAWRSRPYYDDDAPYRRYDPRPETQTRTRVYAYEHRGEREQTWSERAECREDWRRSVTGTVHQSEDKAQLAAQEAWAREIENRHGTRWSDIGSAGGMTAECIAKVPNGVFQAAEASALGIRHHVCSITATPCRPSLKIIREEDIAKRAGERGKEKAEQFRENDPRPKIEYYREEPKRRWWQRRRKD